MDKEKIIKVTLFYDSMIRICSMLFGFFAGLFLITICWVEKYNIKEKEFLIPLCFSLFLFFGILLILAYYGNEFEIYKLENKK